MYTNRKEAQGAVCGMSEIHDAFIARLMRALEWRGWSQRDLAHALGIREATVSEWKAGSSPRGGMLMRIADKLDVDVGWLVTGQPQGGANSGPIPPVDEEGIYRRGREPEFDPVAAGRIIREQSESDYGKGEIRPEAEKVFEVLSQPDGIRRFHGHLGAGTRIVLMLDFAQTQEWNHAELLEGLAHAAKWASDEEREVTRLRDQVRELRRRVDGADGTEVPGETGGDA